MRSCGCIPGPWGAEDTPCPDPGAPACWEQRRGRTGQLKAARPPRPAALHAHSPPRRLSQRHLSASQLPACHWARPRLPACTPSPSAPCPLPQAHGRASGSAVEASERGRELGVGSPGNRWGGPVRAHGGQVLAGGSVYQALGELGCSPGRAGVSGPQGHEEGGAGGGAGPGQIHVCIWQSDCSQLCEAGPRPAAGDTPPLLSLPSSVNAGLLSLRCGGSWGVPRDHILVQVPVGPLGQEAEKWGGVEGPAPWSSEGTLHRPSSPETWLSWWWVPQTCGGAGPVLGAA